VEKYTQTKGYFQSKRIDFPSKTYEDQKIEKMFADEQKQYEKNTDDGLKTDR
jgi:hypothetical protein